MKQSYYFYFFKLTVFTMALAGGFTERKLVKNPIGMFLLYKVWPVVFVTIWVPLLLLVFLKMIQFLGNEDWDALLDVMHMFFLGCFTLYMMFVVQLTSADYQNVMQILVEFRTKDRIAIKEFYITIMVWAGIPVCALLFIGGSIYYKDMLAPIWIPFIDNDKALSTELFYGVWAYELIFAFFVCIMLMFWGPFIMVSTVCICKELDSLVGAINWYGSQYFADATHAQENLLIAENCTKTQFNNTLLNGPDMLRFVRKIVERHTIIRR